MSSPSRSASAADRRPANEQWLNEAVRRMPKVELHVHLEGTIQATTLLELARRRHVDLPADDADGLRRWFRCDDFEHFIEIYLACSRCLQQPEDFQRVVADRMAEQARQNIVYTESHFTIGTHLMRGVPGDELRDALWEALQEGERQHGCRLRLIPDIVRNVPYKWADRTVEWALDGRQHGVVALGLSGIESYSEEPFVAHFEAARQAGLGRVAHAGEQAGPESIRSARDRLGVRRIGHGVRAVEEAALLEELAGSGCCLEICPTSNIQLGHYPDLSAHPFDVLRRAGCEVTINSDDPALFGCTLEEEILDLALQHGYGEEELSGFTSTALRHAFLADSERARFERRLQEDPGENT